MSSVTLRAHFDGKHIILDEPFDIPANASLAVTLLPSPEIELDRERAEWAALGLRSLARAYGDDEPEYSTSDLKR